MARLLADAAAGRWDARAVADARGQASWGELDRRVNRWVDLLRSAGLAEGDRVAVLAGNRCESVEALLACLHAGAVVVPVNWHLTAGEIAYVLADAGARHLVADEPRAAAAAEAAERAGSVDGLRLVTGARPLAGLVPLEPALAACDAGEPAGQRSGAPLLYTSGTTGHPKGVVNDTFTAGAPLARITDLALRVSALFGFPGRGTALVTCPWYHSAQLYFTLFPLLRGMGLVLAERFDAAATLATIDRERVRVCHLVPTQLVRLLRLDESMRAGFSGASLERAWHGGGPCPVPVKRRMLEWWGPVLYEYYGATEGGVVTSIAPEEWLARPGSVGRAAPGGELLVAGPGGEALGPGQPGRVYVRRSPERDFSYAGAPEKTRAAHLAPGTFTYGDDGYLDGDGYLYLTGRSAELIVSGGVNVYPAEVEAVLGAHPAVRDVAVTGVDDEEFGQRVAAVVEPAEAVAGAARTALEAELDRHCRERLAGFKVPRSYAFVPALPRDASGKLRRDRLLERRAAALVADPRTYARGVPHAELALLRRTAPVVWVDAPPQHEDGFWAVLGHEAVVAASRATDVFSSAVGGAFLRDAEGGRQLLVNMDAPEHVRIRRYVSSAFVPSAVRTLEGGVRAHARATVAGLLERGEFDVVRDLAAEFPLLVLADLLGVPREDRGLLFAWSNALVGFDDPELGGGVEGYQRTMMEIFRYGLSVAADRRRRPRDDLLTRILTTEVDGRRLSETEFCHLWLLLVIAGHETSRHLISGGLEALAARPAARERLASDPAVVPSAVEELLRWVTPIMQFRRTATRDTELGGQRIAEGDKVVLSFVAANRDEAVFAEPDRLDLERDPNPHVAFGIGPHYCLGAHLVRLEMAVLLAELGPHLPGFALTGERTRMASNFMSSVTALPARIAPAAQRSRTGTRS